MNNGKLKAVIWDMDGVLLDSEPVHFETWRIVFERYGLAFDEAAMRYTFGMTSPEVIRRIGGEDLPHDTAARMIAEKEILFRDMISRKAVYLPGAREWLDKFSRSGLQQALASSGSPENINVVLTALDAREFFKVIVSGKDLPSKPSPVIFLEAARQLNVSPENCLVIEDAIAGVSAAKAAGMTCLALTTTNAASDLTHADQVCEDLAELSGGHIRQLFA